MKKKLHIVLLALCLCCTVAFAACGEKNSDKIATTNKLSLDDYAMTLSEARKEGVVVGGGKNYTAATALPYDNVYSYDQATNTVRFDKDGKYGLYNVALDKAVALAEYQFISCTELYAVCTKSDTHEVRYYSYDGVLLSTDSVPNVELNEDGYARVVTNNTEAEKDEGVPVFGGATVGETMKATELLQMIGYSEEDALLVDYTASMRENNDCVALDFYKDGKKTTLTFPATADTESLAYVSGKIVYRTVQAVAYDAQTGYNLVMGIGTAAQKQNVTYYAFDIASGKTKTLSLGYAITSVSPLYNTRTKAYDALQVDAIPNRNGVALVDDRTAIQSYIIDGDGKVGFDLSVYGNPYSMVRLKDDRILYTGAADGRASHSYLMDGKGNLLADLGAATRHVTDNLIVVGNPSVHYGAVDFDGKVVMPLQYGSLNFFGDTAYTTVYSTATDSATKFVSPSDVQGKLLEDRYPLGTEEQLNYVTAYESLGLIVTVKYFEEETDKGYTYTFYSFGGNRLMQVKDYGGSGMPLQSSSYDDGYYASYEAEILGGNIVLTVRHNAADPEGQGNHPRTQSHFVIK